LLFLLFLLGFFAIIILITGQTILQQETPKENMGRVLGAYKFLLSIITLVPIMFAGGLIDILGVIPVTLGIAVVIILAGILGTVYRRKNFRMAEEKVINQ